MNAETDIFTYRLDITLEEKWEFQVMRTMPSWYLLFDFVTNIFTLECKFNMQILCSGGNLVLDRVRNMAEKHLFLSYESLLPQPDP
ncbi:hypothetical protein NPIL_428151 [Nephila pilipes]|uniref:Uncharacterized protein n=1 Tax=Nephila pilipes TaxID=299642 RepID=A0A8X6THL2_NEPPI|nr:hypothetical protein NPIL_428151 [Nephila pilipes]